MDLPPQAMLTVNTNLNIKSEPVSPNRDRSTPSSAPASSGGGRAQGPIQGQGLESMSYPGTWPLEGVAPGRSPPHSLSSSGSSYDGSDRDDGGAPDFHHQAGAVAPPLQLRPPSAEPQDQEGTSVKRMRLDTWVT